MAKSSPTSPPDTGNVATLDNGPLTIAPQVEPVDPGEYSRQAEARATPKPTEVHEEPLQLEPGKDYAIPVPRGLFQLWHLKFKHFDTGDVRDLCVPGNLSQPADRMAFAEVDPYTGKAVEGLIYNAREFYPEVQRDQILSRQRRPGWSLGPGGAPRGYEPYGFGGGYDPVGTLARQAAAMARDAQRPVR